MIPLELRQKLHTQIEQLSDEKLKQAETLLAELTTGESITGELSSPEEEAQSVEVAQNRLQLLLADIRKNPQPPAVIKKQRSATDADLQPWAGDDLEDCLKLVRETRSQAKF